MRFPLQRRRQRHRSSIKISWIDLRFSSKKPMSQNSISPTELDFLLKTCLTTKSQAGKRLRTPTRTVLRQKPRSKTKSRRSTREKCKLVMKPTQDTVETDTTTVEMIVVTDITTMVEIAETTGTTGTTSRDIARRTSAIRGTNIETVITTEVRMTMVRRDKVAPTARAEERTDVIIEGIMTIGRRSKSSRSTMRRWEILSKRTLKSLHRSKIWLLFKEVRR